MATPEVTVTVEPTVEAPAPSIVVVEPPAPEIVPIEPPVVVVEAPAPSPVEDGAAALLAQAHARIAELELQQTPPVVVVPEPEPVAPPEDAPPGGKHFVHKSLGELFGRAK